MEDESNVILREIMECLKNVFPKKNKKSLDKLKLVHDILCGNNNLKKPNNTIRGFTLKKATGDGYCFYHAVVQSLHHVNKNKIPLIANGIALREYILLQLNLMLRGDRVLTPAEGNIIRSVSRALYSESEDTLNKTNKTNNNINLHVRIQDIIDNIINETWGGGPFIQLVAYLLGIRISYYDYSNKKFHVVSPDGIVCNEANTIYIRLKKGHYDSLFKNNK